MTCTRCKEDSDIDIYEWRTILERTTIILCDKCWRTFAYKLLTLAQLDNEITNEKALRLLQKHSLLEGEPK